MTVSCSNHEVFPARACDRLRSPFQLRRQCTFTQGQQAPSDAVRVTMSMHPDGSRTTYNFDNAQHTAIATTTDPDGKVRQTIRYRLDNAGRFSTGEVSGADGRIRLKSSYKYDEGGHILEEIQTAADVIL